MLLRRGLGGAAVRCGCQGWCRCRCRLDDFACDMLQHIIIYHSCQNVREHVTIYYDILIYCNILFALLPGQGFQEQPSGGTSRGSPYRIAPSILALPLIQKILNILNPKAQHSYSRTMAQKHKKKPGLLRAAAGLGVSGLRFGLIITYR